MKVKDHKSPGRRRANTSDKVIEARLKPTDIPPGKAARILNRLNSFRSAGQLESTIQKHTKRKILSTGDAQRILHSRAELGEFQDLQQVWIVYRIGAKKFDLLARALSN